jgi:hypothetical protein
MANYKEVFQLAQDKGYYSILCHLAKYRGSAELPHGETDGASELCELTLIQKWLRDEHKAFVEVGQDKKVYFCKVYGKVLSPLGFTKNYRTYEDAMLQGINVALKLI